MFCHVQNCTLNVHINIFFCMGFRHVHVCTNDYPYYCCMGFRQVHFCTNEYLYSYWFCHVHVCTNDYPFPCEWVFVMYISVLMTIHIFEWNVVFYISVRMTIFDEVER